MSLDPRASLEGPDGISIARSLCRKFLSAAGKYEFNAFQFDDLMKALLQVQAIPVLDELFADDAESHETSVRVLKSFHSPVLDVVPDHVLLGWCDGDPCSHYPLAAAVASLFKRPKEGAPHDWTPLAVKLLQLAPDPSFVLKIIIDRLYPSSWSGSLATKLEGRLKLLNSLPTENSELAAQMEKAIADFEAYIITERRREMDKDRADNNRFE